MSLKEFKARLDNDKEFAAKFANIKDEKEFMAIAKSEGYDFEKICNASLDDFESDSLIPILLRPPL